ncbi:MAG: hypothetical protein WBC91_15875 [Phototrophicaceae bacterium]
MRNFKIERSSVNIEKLDADLRVALGAAYLGLTADSNVVTIHAVDSISDAQIQQGRAIVGSHDVDSLTSEQQAKQDIQVEIATLKQSIGNINSLTVTEATTAIKLLYKVLQLNDLI